MKGCNCCSVIIALLYIYFIRISNGESRIIRRELDVIKSVEDSIKHNIFGTGTIALREAVERSNNIMYIADNSGEIIFDKFLLENLPLNKVTYVVKGGPIVNDAIMEDAIQTGIVDLVKVIDNGHSAQGTILKECSNTFRSEFNKADLIISKGQANFETLSDISNKTIFYLLRAKCSSVASASPIPQKRFLIKTEDLLDLARKSELGTWRE